MWTLQIIQSSELRKPDCWEAQVAVVWPLQERFVYSSTVCVCVCVCTVLSGTLAPAPWPLSWLCSTLRPRWRRRWPPWWGPCSGRAPRPATGERRHDTTRHDTTRVWDHINGLEHAFVRVCVQFFTHVVILPPLGQARSHQPHHLGRPLAAQELDGQLCCLDMWDNSEYQAKKKGWISL